MVSKSLYISESKKLFEVIKSNISNYLQIQNYVLLEGVELNDIVMLEVYHFDEGKILVLIFPTEKCPKALLNIVYEIIQNTRTYQEE